MTLETARLRLSPYSPGHLLALIEGEGRFAECFGSPAAAGLRAFAVSDDVSPAWLARLRGATDPDPWLFGFAVVHKESQSVIGCLGFKGPPGDDGVVEIAYGIVPGFQSRGYATEAAEAGVAFAFGCDLVRSVRAHTLPTPSASTSVLAKCGFEKTGEVLDPEDGLVWRWDRGRGPA